MSWMKLCTILNIYLEITISIDLGRLYSDSCCWRNYNFNRNSFRILYHYFFVEWEDKIIEWILRDYFHQRSFKVRSWKSLQPSLKSLQRAVRVLFEIVWIWIYSNPNERKTSTVAVPNFVNRAKLNTNSNDARQAERFPTLISIFEHFEPNTKKKTLNNSNSNCTVRALFDVDHSFEYWILDPKSSTIKNFAAGQMILIGSNGGNTRETLIPWTYLIFFSVQIDQFPAVTWSRVCWSAKKCFKKFIHHHSIW